MKVFLFLAILIFLFNCFNSFAQTNFDKEQSAADPAKRKDIIQAEEKMAIHQAYFKKAVETKNLQQQFYGHLYLWADYLGKHDYEAATRQLFSADSLAKNSKNLSWQAAIDGRRGILAFELNDPASALKHFMLVLEGCKKTKDSFCIAGNLEEVAITYHKMLQYDSAKHYFLLAIPLLRKYTDSNQLYGYYNNYSNLLKDMGDYKGAKQYLDSSIAIVSSWNNLLKQVFSKNNLASFYIDTRAYDTAITILKECVNINDQHGWLEQLSYNYSNLGEAYSKKGNYPLAYDYLKRYHLLKDSLKSAEIQVKMANLNAAYEAEKKELILKQSQLDLTTSKRSSEKKTWLILSGFTIVGIGIWRWFAQMKMVKKKRLQSQQDLIELTRILLDKNTALTALEEKLISQHENTVSDNHSYIINPVPAGETASLNDKDSFENSLYNQRILTNADWTSFKICLKKLIPGIFYGFVMPLQTLQKQRKECFFL